jgi:hypothetical protein
VVKHSHSEVPVGLKPVGAGLPRLIAHSLDVIFILGKKASKILEYFNPFKDFPINTE